jgi:hypothetical protein
MAKPTPHSPKVARAIHADVLDNRTRHNGRKAPLPPNPQSKRQQARARRAAKKLTAEQRAYYGIELGGPASSRRRDIDRHRQTLAAAQRRESLVRQVAQEAVQKDVEIDLFEVNDLPDGERAAIYKQVRADIDEHGLQYPTSWESPQPSGTWTGKYRNGRRVGPGRWQFGECSSIVVCQQCDDCRETSKKQRTAVTCDACERIDVATGEILPPGQRRSSL